MPIDMNHMRIPNLGSPQNEKDTISQSFLSHKNLGSHLFGQGMKTFYSGGVEISFDYIFIKSVILYNNNKYNKDTALHLVYRKKSNDSFQAYSINFRLQGLQTKVIVNLTSKI